MDETPDPKPSKLKAAFWGLVFSPMKLRAVLSLAMLGAWYAALGMPRAAEIDEFTSRLGLEKVRLATAKDVEQLRRQVARFEDRIPGSSDQNEWLAYMLAGTRLCGLKVESLDTSGAKPAGPYRAVVAKLTVVGTFAEVEEFLRWLESNERLLRVDSLSVAPSKDGGDDRDTLRVAFVILGLTA